MAAATPTSGLLGLSGVRRTRVRSTSVEGVPGFRFFGGYVEREEKNPKLRGTQRYQTFADILANTSIVAAGVRYYLNLVSKAGWSVEPPEMEGVRRQRMADELADRAESILYDMRRPWHRVVRRAAMYRFYGFSIQEWTAKRREDGSIGFLDIAPRPQHTIEQWDIANDGSVLGVVQVSPMTGESIYLPRGKVVYCVEDSLSDNPEGVGLLRHMVDANERLKQFETLEHYGFETDLRGMPVIKGPFAAIEDEVRAGNLSREDANKMIEPLKDFLANHVKSPQLGLFLDSEVFRDEGETASPSSTPQWSFDVVQGEPYGQEEVAAAIERLNRELARIMGVEGLLLGGEKVGSMALSQDKSHTFGLIVDSALRELAEQFESDILGPLWSMNGWDPEMMPTLKTDQVQYRDVQSVTKSLVDMANAGVVLDPDWEGANVLLDLLGLPRIDLDARAEAASIGDPVPEPNPEPTPPTPEPGTEDDEVTE